MPRIDLQRPLSVPSVPARAALSSILREISEERKGWADFSLYLNLGSLGLPDVGYVAIPAVISPPEETTEPRHEIRFTLRARRSPDVFPTFDGSAGIDAAGPSSATLWLAGAYEVPMRRIGALLNEKLGHAAAEKSLGNMLGEFADAIVARVERREMDMARYRLIFNTGD